jgi:hypothetical protein
MQVNIDVQDELGNVDLRTTNNTKTVHSVKMTAQIASISVHAP